MTQGNTHINIIKILQDFGKRHQCVIANMVAEVVVDLLEEVNVGNDQTTDRVFAVEFLDAGIHAREWIAHATAIWIIHEVRDVITYGRVYTVRPCRHCCGSKLTSLHPVDANMNIATVTSIFSGATCLCASAYLTNTSCHVHERSYLFIRAQS